jgi:hypothetical protein
MRKILYEPLPAMIEKMKNQGEIFEEDFDDNGIEESTKKNVNNLIVSRRRGCILTGKEFVDRENAKRKAAETTKKAKEDEKAAKSQKRLENKRKRETPASSSKKKV